jgi:hypothetical protein
MSMPNLYLKRADVVWLPLVVALQRIQKTAVAAFNPEVFSAATRWRTKPQLKVNKNGLQLII